MPLKEANWAGRGRKRVSARRAPRPVKRPTRPAMRGGVEAREAREGGVVGVRWGERRGVVAVVSSASVVTIVGGASLLSLLGLSTPVTAGKIAVTIVALYIISLRTIPKTKEDKNSRRRAPKTEQHPRRHQPGHHTPHTNHGDQPPRDPPKPDHTNPPHADAIRQRARQRTRDNRNELIDESERADKIPHALDDAEARGDDEGERGVEEDEEGDGGEGHEEEVGRCLEGGGGGGEGEVAGEEGAEG